MSKYDNYQTPSNVDEARWYGWTVDDTVYPWVAYLGARFYPDRWVQIETPEWRPES